MAHEMGCGRFSYEECCARSRYQGHGQVHHIVSVNMYPECAYAFASLYEPVFLYGIYFITMKYNHVSNKFLSKYLKVNV